MPDVDVDDFAGLLLVGRNRFSSNIGRLDWFSADLAEDGDRGLISYGWRQVPVGLASWLSLGMGAVGGALFLAGLASTWFWRPAVVMIEAAAAPAPAPTGPPGQPRPAAVSLFGAGALATW
jgi:hypothetical protein